MFSEQGGPPLGGGGRAPTLREIKNAWPRRNEERHLHAAHSPYGDHCAPRAALLGVEPCVRLGMGQGRVRGCGAACGCGAVQACTRGGVPCYARRQVRHGRPHLPPLPTPATHSMVPPVSRGEAEGCGVHNYTYKYAYVPCKHGGVFGAPGSHPNLHSTAFWRPNLFGGLVTPKVWHQQAFPTQAKVASLHDLHGTALWSPNLPEW